MKRDKVHIGIMKCQKPTERNQCCCNCKNQIQIMCHPWNGKVGKGRISKRLGWACTTFIVQDPREDRAIYMDSVHGICEMHELKTK